MELEFLAFGILSALAVLAPRIPNSRAPHLVRLVFFSMMWGTVWALAIPDLRASPYATMRLDEFLELMAGRARVPTLLDLAVLCVLSGFLALVVFGRRALRRLA